MSSNPIRDFHAHIYFDPDELEQAQALAAEAHARFGVPVGRFHVQPIGPHPRGSCQLTVMPDQFGDFAQWLALNRNGLTVFAHTSTGDDPQQGRLAGSGRPQKGNELACPNV